MQINIQNNFARASARKTSHTTGKDRQVYKISWDDFDSHPINVALYFHTSFLLFGFQRSSFIMLIKSWATSPNMLAASLLGFGLFFARLSKSLRDLSCRILAASASSVLLWK